MAATTTEKGSRSRTVKATAEGKAPARDAMKMSLTALQKHTPGDGRLAYSEAITEVAKRTKELSGSNQAPGAKQVLMVQKALGGKDPVEASGMTLAQLKRYVGGEMPRDESRKLRQGGMAELEKKVADPFTKSRHMGGVLLGFHEQQQQDKRATRRADKAEQAEKAAEGAEAQAETAAA
jgi:hypothetical protein